MRAAPAVQRLGSAVSRIYLALSRVTADPGRSRVSEASNTGARRFLSLCRAARQAAPEPGAPPRVALFDF
jgi:hypothetical protein